MPAVFVALLVRHEPVIVFMLRLEILIYIIMVTGSFQVAFVTSIFTLDLFFLTSLDSSY